MTSRDLKAGIIIFITESILRVVETITGELHWLKVRAPTSSLLLTLSL